MLLTGIVSVLHEDEEGEILSPNLVAVPSHRFTSSLLLSPGGINPLPVLVHEDL